MDVGGCLWVLELCYSSKVIQMDVVDSICVLRGRTKWLGPCDGGHFVSENFTKSLF